MTVQVTISKDETKVFDPYPRVTGVQFRAEGAGWVGFGRTEQAAIADLADSLKANGLTDGTMRVRRSY